MRSWHPLMSKHRQSWKKTSNAHSVKNNYQRRHSSKTPTATSPTSKPQNFSTIPSSKRSKMKERIWIMRICPNNLPIKIKMLGLGRRWRRMWKLRRMFWGISRVIRSSDLNNFQTKKETRLWMIKSTQAPKAISSESRTYQKLSATAAPKVFWMSIRGLGLWSRIASTIHIWAAWGNIIWSRLRRRDSTTNN